MRCDPVFFATAVYQHGVRKSALVHTILGCALFLLCSGKLMQVDRAK